MISRITPSNAERSVGALSSKTIMYVAERFRVDGALILESVVKAEFVVRARRAFGEAYSRYLDGNEHPDAPMVGDRRLMITVDLQPPFDDPQLFANPWVLSVMDAVLDEGFVLAAFAGSRAAGQGTGAASSRVAPSRSAEQVGSPWKERPRLMMERSGRVISLNDLRGRGYAGEIGP